MDLSVLIMRKERKKKSILHIREKKVNIRRLKEKAKREQRRNHAIHQTLQWNGIERKRERERGEDE